MSAKELGQIHTLNSDFTIGNLVAPGLIQRFDLAGIATDKLQRLIRQGNYFKLVGIDMSIAPTLLPGTAGGSISGYFRYYSPTKGRCAAFRHAFKAMADQMAMQGIAMRNNHLYDFKVALSDNPTLLPLIKNQATLDGTTGLALNGAVGSSVFGVYNKSVIPNTTNTPVGDLFDEGFDTLLQSGAGKTDFVLNESDVYSGNEDFADLTYDRIPFQIQFAEDGSSTVSFQWRPDPALYVAVLTGNLEMYAEDINTVPTLQQLDVQLSFMVSGWKSVMGNPNKKRSSKKISKKQRK